MHRRRTYLRLVAAGATGFLAGCGEDSGGSNTDTTTNQATEDTTTATTTAGARRRAKFVPDDSNEWFGESVALSGGGSTALVGVKDTLADDGEQSDAAYVFDI